MSKWFALPLGYLCNNGCRFCGQGELRNTHPEFPSFEQVRESLGAARDAGATCVWLVGGEPTTRDDLPDLIGLARESGFDRVGVQTNGRRLAYPGYRRDLLQSAPTDLEVSLQGVNAPCHDHLTRVPGSFEQTLRGLRGLQGTPTRLALAQVLDRSNFRHLGELLRLARHLGSRRLRWSFPEDVGGVRGDLRRLGPRLALLGPRLRAITAQARSAGIALSLAGVPDCHLPKGFDRGPTSPGAELRSYGEVCGGCPARAECVGLPAGYARHHGTDELTPLSAPREIPLDEEAPGPGVVSELPL